MPRNPLKILIIGAGTGSLCLAQGLKSDGVDVEVFERDHAPADRQHGYRLSISPTGSRALKACLPDALFQKLIENSAKPSQGLTFLDHRLNRLLAIELPLRDRTSVDNERPISRAALRRILLEGLDSIVRFGRKFVSYEDAPAGRVMARFEDGSTATADVLIGADGASSRVRGQRLPDAKRVETGITVISAKFAANAAVRAETPPEIWRGPALILGPQGCFMFASGFEHDVFSPRDDEDYVMWGFSAHHEAFALPKNPEAIGGDALKSAALALTGNWHPALRQLLERAEAATVAAFPVKTSVPIAPWPTSNVTLLGDALHNMTPYRGIGANTALKDAAALRRALVAVDRGEAELIPALAAYERDMVDYGFKAVRTSLDNMRRFHSTNIVARALTKTVLRTIDRVPMLKAQLQRGD